MAPTPSIVIVQSFQYRNAYEEFSNRYHFNGGVPADPAAWQNMADSLCNALRPCFSNLVKFARAYGYIGGQVASVWSHDFAAPPLVPMQGSYVGAGNFMPGDVAATTRWDTGALNSRGRKIYLRKYWHDVKSDINGYDQLADTQRQAFDTLAAHLVDGTALGMPYVLAGPNGVTASGGATNPWLTTRTLKRRGRRPLP